MSQLLQVITDTDRRGAQVFATDLHAELERGGRTVRTVALAPGTSGGLDVPVLGATRLAGATLRALRREILASGTVVAHGSSTLPACALSSTRTGVPFVYRQISDSLFWAPARLRRARVRLGLSRATLIVALWAGSADVLHEHFGVPRSKLRIIPNGVPPDRFLAIDPDDRRAARRSLGLEPYRPLVASVGALVPEKGVDLAISAVADLDDAQLLVAGEGTERERLERLAEHLAPGRVHFSGSLETPLALYAAADVVVLPSRGGDSMPAVLIEAGLSGVPAVATPIGGIPDIVVDGVTGALVPVERRDSLAAAIAAILENNGHSRRLGTAARAHCLEHFSIDAVARQWAAVLDEVASLRE